MELVLRVFSSLLLILSAVDVGAAECASKDIQKLRNDCQTILSDIEGTRKLGRQEEEKGHEAAKVGAVKGASCFIDTGKLISSCYGASPSCAKQIVKIPKTVQKCSEAIDLIDKAIAHYRKASVYFGAAIVAFVDQGGESVLSQLAECGSSGCKEYSSLNELLQEDSERVQRNIERLIKYKSRLEKARSILEACRVKVENCEQDIPSDAEMDTLEVPPEEGQEIPLP